MYNIYVLWATPRSTSTAFEWMMRMRGDMVCFHEPFGEAWYFGEDARAPRLTADSLRKPGISYASVLEKILNAAKNHSVFSKDMPQNVEHLWNDEFLNHFQHSFLIRDPAKVLSSLQRSYDKAGDHEGFTSKEIGFAEQRQLFDILADKHGQAPVVIDSDDLLRDPHTMVEIYCNSIGIPFIADALSWKPGERSEVLWYDDDDSIWHESLKNSDGLKPQKSRIINVEDLPPNMQEFYHEFIPHYQHLHAHRIKLD